MRKKPKKGERLGENKGKLKSRVIVSIGMR